MNKKQVRKIVRDVLNEAIIRPEKRVNNVKALLMSDIPEVRKLAKNWCREWRRGVMAAFHAGESQVRDADIRMDRIIEDINDILAAENEPLVDPAKLPYIGQWELYDSLMQDVCG